MRYFSPISSNKLVWIQIDLDGSDFFWKKNAINDTTDLGFDVHVGFMQTQLA